MTLQSAWPLCSQWEGSCPILEDRYVWHWHKQKELCQLCPAKNHATRQETCIIMVFEPISSGFTSIGCKTYYIYICIGELSRMIPKETVSYGKLGITFSSFCTIEKAPENDDNFRGTDRGVERPAFPCGNGAVKLLREGGVKLGWEYVLCWATKSLWWDWGW